MRVALGLEKITLWGSSYGNHLGLAYLRHHSDRVERTVLTKDEDGATRTIVIGTFDFKRELAKALGGIRDISAIPAQMQALKGGDFQELGAAALRSRRSDVWSMMTVIMDCACGASPGRWERIAKEAADPAKLTGDSINAPFGPLTRQAAGNVALPPAFRAPIRSDCKELFVTGSLDARTPPSNVEELQAGFPNQMHLAVTGETHDSLEMLRPDYQRALKAFISGEDVASQAIEMSEMRFRPLGR